MPKNAKKPQIRFKGFTDAWEQRKVSELLVERNEQAPMSEEYPLMAFIANEGVTPKGERYDRSSLVTDTENKLYKRTEFGDFIYSSNNLETGSIGLNKYGKACISPVYSIFLPTGIANSDFLGRRLVRKDFINLMVKWRQGVIYGQWKIHESDFLKIEISVPLVKEQCKIGAFLDNLDNLITLHQRKLDKLKNIKKSMLEKMFPKNGSNVPEIRFTGFTDAWEQRKLGDLCSEIGDGLHSAPIYDEKGSYFFINGNNLVNGKIIIDENETKKVSQNIFNDNNKNLDNTTLLLSINGTIGNLAYYQGEQVMLGKSAAYLKCKFVDKTYLYGVLQTNLILKSFMASLTGTTIKNLGLEVIKNTYIFSPKVNEQVKIGKYFHNLDNLITLHQRKLEKLQNIKKACLEKMFV